MLPSMLSQRDGQLVEQVMTPAAQAKALKDISTVIEKAVSIERKSWNMDKNESEGPAGVFQININVPDPLPTSEHLKNHNRNQPTHR